MGVEDHQKDRAQLGIEAINRKEQMVSSRGQTPKHMEQTGHHKSWKWVRMCVCEETRLCVIWTGGKKEYVSHVHTLADLLYINPLWMSSPN